MRITIKYNPPLLHLFLFITLTLSLPLSAQTLQPGFDAAEYQEMLRISAAQLDTPNTKVMPLPQDYHLAYRSPITGMDNRWDLWLNRDQTIMVVSLRGTTRQSVSWLENFYAATIPAKGTLQLNDSTAFPYQFAGNPHAAVHVGWALGICSMAPEIVRTIKARHDSSTTRQLIIMGHSQGGALAFLLRSYLHYLVEAQQFPPDLTIKTYCSAAPKPGNLYYAYDFDHITRNGWAFTVVNALDWVPETPFSLQTLRDYNTLNPFTDVRKQLNKQSFLVRVYLKHMFNRLDRTSRKAQRTFTKYLGKTLYKQVKKSQPQFKQPAYTTTMNYMRAGVPIVLQPDGSYLQQFPNTGPQVFLHHGVKQYSLLTKTVYGKE